ncbi:5-bromo-4-chloroindolyl phosphate hydrolysis family protein [Nitratifractor sp.]
MSETTLEQLGKRWQRKTGALLLYLLMLPLLLSLMVSLIGGNIRLFLLKLAAFLLWGGAAAAVSHGIRQSLDYEEADVARAPRIPWKIVGALLLAATIFLLGYFAGHASAGASLFAAIVGATGVVLYYGVDPRRDKLPDMEGVDADFLLQSLDEARDTLETIRLHSRKIHDLTLHRAIEHALEQAEEILGIIEHDPIKLRKARKFLVVYIEGVARVTERYVALDRETVDEETRQRLQRLLEEVQERFDRELHRLNESERFDLDVQIDALRKQIKE